MPRRTPRYLPSALKEFKGACRVHLKKIVFAAGVVTTLAGSVIALDRVHPVIEPWFLATHGYTREMVVSLRGERKAETQLIRNEIRAAQEEGRTVNNTQTSILRDVQIELAEGKRDNAVRAQRAANIELDKTPPNQEVLREKLMNDIGELQLLVDKLNDQIKTLNRIKAREQQRK